MIRERAPTYQYLTLSLDQPRKCTEPEFVNEPRIDSQPNGPAGGIDFLKSSAELEFLKSLWGLGTEEEQGYRTGPPGHIGWRNSFLGIDSWAS